MIPGNGVKLATSGDEVAQYWRAVIKHAIPKRYPPMLRVRIKDGETSFLSRSLREAF
jgi:hypothetical protein